MEFLFIININIKNLIFRPTNFNFGGGLLVPVKRQLLYETITFYSHIKTVSLLGLKTTPKDKYKEYHFATFHQFHYLTKILLKLNFLVCLKSDF